MFVITIICLFPSFLYKISLFNSTHFPTISRILIFASLQLFPSDIIIAIQSGGSVAKRPPAMAEYLSLIPGLGRSHGEGNCNPLQYSCLGNSMDRGAWWTTVHGVTKSWTCLRLSMQCLLSEQREISNISRNLVIAEFLFSVQIQHFFKKIIMCFL